MSITFAVPFPTTGNASHVAFYLGMPTSVWPSFGSAPLVDRIGDRFDVRRIYAEDVPAQVIEMQAFRYWSHQFFVEDSVGRCCPDPPAVDHPVALLGGTPLPNPAVPVEIPVSHKRHAESLVDASQ